VKKSGILLLALIPMFGNLVSCSSQVKARKPVSYRFEHGRTALVKNGVAYAPRNARPPSSARSPPATASKASPTNGAAAMVVTSMTATIVPAPFPTSCARPDCCGLDALQRLFQIWQKR
jgi:hypothetical protein